MHKPHQFEHSQQLRVAIAMHKPIPKQSATKQEKKLVTLWDKICRSLSLEPAVELLLLVSGLEPAMPELG